MPGFHLWVPTIEQQKCCSSLVQLLDVVTKLFRKNQSFISAATDVSSSPDSKTQFATSLCTIYNGLDLSMSLSHNSHFLLHVSPTSVQGTLLYLHWSCLSKFLSFSLVMLKDNSSFMFFLKNYMVCELQRIHHWNEQEALSEAPPDLTVSGTFCTWYGIGSLPY